MSSKIDDDSNHGKCPQLTQDTSFQSAFFFRWDLIIFFVMMIMMVLGVIVQASATQWSMESTQVAFPDTDTPISALIHPTPKTSILSTQYANTNAVCPITLTVSGKNYHLKVFDLTHKGKIIAEFFIRSNEKLQTTLPRGTYMLKYVSGSQWYGEKDLFGLFGSEGKINPVQLGNGQSCQNERLVSL